MITSHRGGSGSSGSSSPVIEISAIHTKLNDLNHIYDKFGIRADISIYYKYYTSDICKKKWKLDIGKVKFFIQFIKMMFIYLIVNNVGPNVLKTLKHISPWFANIVEKIIHHLSSGTNIQSIAKQSVSSEVQSLLSGGGIKKKINTNNNK